MLLRVCAWPFHKMDIAGWRLTSLFCEVQGDQEEAEADGHPAKESPCKISLHTSACNLADLQLLQTQIFMIFGRFLCSHFLKHVLCERGEKSVQSKLVLLSMLFAAWAAETLILFSWISPISIISRVQNCCLHGVSMERNCSVSWSEDFTFLRAC